MSTYILSYPGPDFRVPGSAASRSSGNARAAFQEWLALCDHILRAGGRILVLNPQPAPAEPTAQQGTGAVYASIIGAPFLSPSTGEGPLFLRARASREDPPLDQDP